MQSCNVQTTSKSFFKSHLRKACSHITSQSITDRWKLEMLSYCREMKASFLQLLLERTARTVWSLFSMVGTQPLINTSNSAPSQLNQSVAASFSKGKILTENLEFTQWFIYATLFIFLNFNPVSYNQGLRNFQIPPFYCGPLLKPSWTDWPSCRNIKLYHFFHYFIIGFWWEESQLWSTALDITASIKYIFNGTVRIIFTINNILKDQNLKW